MNHLAFALLLLPAAAWAQTSNEAATHQACADHALIKSLPPEASTYERGWENCTAFEADYMPKVKAASDAAAQRDATAKAARDAAAQQELNK